MGNIDAHVDQSWPNRWQAVPRGIWNIYIRKRERDLGQQVASVKRIAKPALDERADVDFSVMTHMFFHFIQSCRVSSCRPVGDLTLAPAGMYIANVVRIDRRQPLETVKHKNALAKGLRDY